MMIGFEIGIPWSNPVYGCIIGPRGTGKSSIVQIAAERRRLDVYSADMRSIQSTEQLLDALLRQVPSTPERAVFHLSSLEMVSEPSLRMLTDLITTLGTFTIRRDDGCFEVDMRNYLWLLEFTGQGEFQLPANCVQPIGIVETPPYQRDELLTIFRGNFDPLLSKVRSFAATNGFDESLEAFTLTILDEQWERIEAAGLDYLRNSCMQFAIDRTQERAA